MSVKDLGSKGKSLYLGLLGGLILASFTTLGALLYLWKEIPPTERLEVAMRLLHKGDGEAAARIANGIEETDLSPDDLSKKHFVIGAHARDIASRSDQLQKAFERTEQAVEHLRKSQELHFPNGYEGLGNFHLGMALYDLFRWEEAQEPLSVSAERWPAGRSDAIERLIDIDLANKPKEIESALERIEHWRTLPPSSPYDEERADIKEMQTLIAAGKFDQANKMLERIGTDSPYRSNGLYLAGVATLALSEQKIPTEKLALKHEALDLFSEATKAPDVSHEIRRKAGLEIGRILKSLGRIPEAISTLSILRLAYPHTPESLAAGCDEIEMHLQERRIEDVVATLRHVRSNLGDLRWYASDWLDLNELRDRLVKVGGDLIDQKSFPYAATYATSLPPFCEEVDRVHLESRLYELWAKSLSSSAGDADAKKRYHQLAAQRYEELLRLQGRSTDYNEWLWRAISNYRDCDAYAESNRLLERYLSLETRENRPKGHFVRAMNLAALKREEEAARALQQVIASNEESPLAYDARLELARILVSREEYNQAELLLLDSINGTVRPESPIWRDSLYLLSDIYYMRGEREMRVAMDQIEKNPSQIRARLPEVEAGYEWLLKSAERTEEFLHRYPRDPRRVPILYRQARTFQMASFWPHLQLREGLALTQTEKDARESEFKELLTEARQAYRKLKSELPSAESFSASGSTGSDSSTKDMIRNSFFGEADLFYQSEDYESALAVYTEGANRFKGEPESIEAMKQIALCQKKIGQLEACRRTLELTRDLLDLIPAEKDGDFLKVTPHDRAGWSRYLNALIEEVSER